MLGLEEGWSRDRDTVMEIAVAREGEEDGEEMQITEREDTIGWREKYNEQSEEKR